MIKLFSYRFLLC